MIQVMAGAILGLMWFIAGIATWQKLRGAPWRFIKLAGSLIGLAWALLYLFILLFPVSYTDTIMVNMVRPLIILTLGVGASGAIQGARKQNGHKLE